MPRASRLVVGGLILAWLAIASPVLADVVSPGPEATSVTIYRDRPGSTGDITDPAAEANGLALITETRTIDVPAGASKISFRGVADGVIPETAKIEGLPGQVVEYNFDYDLMSPGSIVSRSIGRTVRLIRTDRKTGRQTEQAAVIRSGPAGVMLEIDGKLEALRCSGSPERLVFDQIPAGLADKPTLSLLTRAAAPGRYKVRLTYLATGFDWSADYVARVAPDGRTLDLSGWITLVNKSDASFVDAPTSVVAGRWHREDNDGSEREPPAVQPVQLQCWPLNIDWATHGRAEAIADLNRLPQFMPAPAPPMMMKEAEVAVTGSRIAKQTELGDYKLYTLAEPTTVAAHQTKQAQLLDQPGVPVQRLYSYRFDIDDAPDAADGSAPATVLLRLENKAATGLGKALPAGTVSVMQPDARSGMVLAGQKTLDDIPVGLPLDIELGRAMDVTVRSRVVTRRRLAMNRERIAVEVTIANDKPVPIRLEFRHGTTGSGLRIASESSRHGTKGGDPMWTLNLKPDERRVLTYTVEQDR